MASMPPAKGRRRLRQTAAGKPPSTSKNQENDGVQIVETSSCIHASPLASRNRIHTSHSSANPAWRAKQILPTTAPSPNGIAPNTTAAPRKHHKLWPRDVRLEALSKTMNHPSPFLARPSSIGSQYAAIG